ncbi:3-oxoacyl-[acyl-carrier protein] reductase [Actinomycetospora succinea]|uniref:3-oxoacyl-[acyl-carrier protein] reductase n=1 Tax=Actinomycetospora succinea TaxID=663603 RepID=A0A4R6VLZ9_9PSEU|nr:3-oxoacyl-ACP reductase [Actinomycetospora succinea]TDQ62951.1 3-oxoacyl-[acyl-carrier protein] reductase [Actinomycetospora succinea]
MSNDWYSDFVNSGFGKSIAGTVGLPPVPRLRRYEPGQPLLSGPALLGTATASGRVAKVVRSLLTDLGVEVHEDPQAPVGGGSSTSKVAAGIVDATGLSSPADLAAIQGFLTPVMRRVGPSGRILVIGDVPGEAGAPSVRAARRALEGLVRSAAKEARYGATVNLVHVADGAENDIESTLRFFLSSRSAFVDGQRLEVGTVPGFAGSSQGVDWDKPLAGRTAVVTGAARGIGATVAKTLRRDGATVICVDVPAAGDALARTANDVGGSALQLDITADHAPATLLDHAQRHGGLDVVVHNAGITRDKLLANQDRDRWNSVIDVNLNAQLAINDALLASDVFHRGGRIVTVSSMAGIAGNRGQTAYGASKAGVIGMVDATAPLLVEKDATINAVAPGFIETDMTAAMPVGTREAGRRLSSMTQGGLPIDVAETIAWFAQGASYAVNGQVLRVDGQNYLGA